MMGSVISVVSEAFVDYRGSRLRSRATISSRYANRRPFLCGGTKEVEEFHEGTGLSAFQIRSNESGGGRGGGRDRKDVGVTPVDALGKEAAEGPGNRSLDRVNQRAR